MIEVCICLTFGEAQTGELIMDPGVESTRCLFETVQHSLESKQMKLSIKSLKSLWLLDVHLLNKSTGECFFYIHLVDLPPHIHSSSNNWFNEWVPCYMSKGLLIINSFNLKVPLGHKFGLILLYSSVCCLLNLKDPSQTHNWFIWWYWDHFPNTFVYNGFVSSTIASFHTGCCIASSKEDGSVSTRSVIRAM